MVTVKSLPIFRFLWKVCLCPSTCFIKLMCIIASTGTVDTTDRARMLMVVVSRLLHLSLDCLIAVVQFKVALRNFSSVKHFKTELTAVSTSILIFVISFIISCLVFTFTVHLFILLLLFAIHESFFICHQILRLFKYLHTVVFGHKFHKRPKYAFWFLKYKNNMIFCSRL